MPVTEHSEHHTVHEGRPYYFYSTQCQTRFAAEPSRYLAGAGTQSAVDGADQPAGTIYTCPMHPEIRQDHPGSCPKCGMSLEPLLPELTDEKNPELVDFNRRFRWTLPFTVVVTFLAMGGHWFGWFPSSAQPWIELVLTG